eukprot:TRINITY_DN2277_c0_g2_i2.p1 TRINITY_DN2277_c0_g2~~TRINITY_DN2277_c0_g2_i2.p1  ORF type:complete len:379 (+),score=62.00 TRINITY_DN2277_c0_g2_i2:55-1191(+)
MKQEQAAFNELRALLCPEKPESSDDGEQIILKAFYHQVGGHSCIVKSPYFPAFLLKPYKNGEHKFYSTVKENSNFKELQQFIPYYYGSVEATAKKIEVDTKEFEETDQRTREVSQDQCTQTLVRSASLPCLDRRNRNSPIESCYDKTSQISNPEEKGKWLRQLFKNRFRKNSFSYMILEDLTREMIFPCILDIKLGSTAFNSAKLESQMQKIKASMSGLYSFRLCGMQVYQARTRNYLFRDKYWGRKVNAENLSDELCSFFCCGGKIKKNLVNLFIQRLKVIETILCKLKCFCFRSCSLLLVYDGLMPDEEFVCNAKNEAFLEKKVKIRFIDFENASFHEPSTEEEFAGEENLDKQPGNDDIITGLVNFQKILSQLLS